MPQTIEIEMHPVKGITICLSAYLFVSLMGIFRKYLCTDISLLQILFFQNFICLLLVLPEALRQGIQPVAKSEWSTYFIRISSGLACSLTFFYLVCHVPISQAFLFQYSASLWIPFVSLLWLKVGFRRDIWYGIIIGFIGILFILKPTQAAICKVSVIGVLCGILQAISMVAIRKLSLKEPLPTLLFYYFLSGTLFAGAFVWNQWPILKLKDISLLCLIGITTYLAQKLITVSLQYASAATLAPICYTSLVFSGVMGFIIWHELPSAMTILGMSLVMLGCIATLFTSRMKVKAPMSNVSKSEAG